MFVLIGIIRHQVASQLQEQNYKSRRTEYILKQWYVFSNCKQNLKFNIMSFFV